MSDVKSYDVWIVGLIIFMAIILLSYRVRQVAEAIKSSNHITEVRK